MNRLYFLIGLVVFQLLVFGRAYSQSADQFELGYPELLCANKDVVPELTVDNRKFEKPPFLDGSFKIAWGDGTESQWEAGKGRELTHQYDRFGIYKLVLTWTGTDGSVVQKEYPFEIRRWYGTTLNIVSSGSCVNTETVFKIVDYEKKTTDTKYFLYSGAVGVENLLKTATQDEVEKDNGKVVHRFNQELCNQQIILRAEDACTLNGGIGEDLASKWITVLAPLNIDFSFEKIPACTGIPFHATIANSSLLTCEREATYDWDFQYNGVYEGKNVLVDAYERPGSYDVTVTAKIKDYPCATTSKVKKLEVINRAVASFYPAADTLCLVGTPPVGVSLTDRSKGDAVTVDWYVDGVHKKRGSGNWVYDAGATGTYEIKQHVYNTCSDSLADTLVVVKQDPDIVRLELPDTLCMNLFQLSGGEVAYRWNWLGNQKQAYWKMKEPDGQVVTYEGLYPQLVFRKPGRHSITVSLNGAGCGGTTLERSGQLWIVDSTLRVDITPSKPPKNGVIELCDGDRLEFSNHSSGEGITNRWYFVQTDGGNSLQMEFVDHTEGNSVSPKVKLVGYGEGRIVNEMSLPFGCQTKSESFRVHVGKDPEVFLTNFPEELCPRDVLDAGLCIFYEWYNNPALARWEFSPNTVDVVEGTLNSAEPKFHFRTSEKYTYKVTVPGVGCPNADTVITGEVRIRVAGLDATVKEKNNLSEVCEGGMLVFTNSASEKDPEGTDLRYEWKITVPQTGEPQGGTEDECEFLKDKRNEKVAAITFRRWGTYDVTAKVIGFCDTVTSTLRIRVKRNPEVRLQDVANCPGTFVLAADTSYGWWNNTPKVQWTIRRADGTDLPGDYTGDAGVLTQIYPRVEFVRPGKYLVKAELENAGCSEEVLSDEAEYWIYNPQVYGDVALKNPLASDPQTTDVCENEVVGFENTMTEEADRLTWEWEVESDVEGGWQFVENGAVVTMEEGRVKPAPSIQFLKYGVYRVSVTTHSTCNLPVVKVFKVIVRGIPVIELQPRLEKMCADRELTLEGNYLQYVDKKNSELTYQWSVVADRDVTPPVFDAVAEFPKFNFNKENAHYVITLNAFSKCAEGGVQVYNSEVDVISIYQKAVFETDSVGCTDFELTLNNVSVGDSLSYMWRVQPQNISGTGWDYISGDEHAERPQLKISEIGFYDISLEVNNICGSDSYQTRVRAYSVPEVQIADIADVCEPLMFVGKDRIVVNENNDAIRSVKWELIPRSVSKPGEYEYVNGTSAESAYPDIVFKDCDYEVKVEYRNRCAEPGRRTFSVRVDEFVPIEPLEDKAVCVLTEPFELNALPSGGIWTLKEQQMPGGDKILYRTGDGKDWFKPEFDPYFEGDIELVYSKANFTCMAHDTMKVHIWPLPRVEAGDSLAMCMNHPPFLLANGTPTGGYWTREDETILAGDYYTITTGPGDFKLKYYYVDGHQCKNVDTTVMTVHPLPNTNFDVKTLNCIRTEVEIKPEQLDGNRFKWDYGDGSSEEISKGDTVHVYDDFGFRTIRNVTTSKFGCVASSRPVQIEIVNVPPPAFFMVDTLRGCARFGVEPGNDRAVLGIHLAVDSAMYADRHNYLSFKWDYGDGTVGDELTPLSPKYYPSGSWDTTYRLNFTVSNMCGVEKTEEVVTVLSAPKVKFALRHQWECTPVVLELQNTTTGNNVAFNWTFENGRTGNVVERTDVRNPVYEFTTDSASTTYYITLKASNACDDDVHTDSLVVKPRSIVAHFTPSKLDACVGEEICFKNNSTDTVSAIVNTYWNFGDGGQDSLWNVCHVFQEARDYAVSLLIDNGCGFHSVTDTVTVHPLPRLALSGEDHLCETDTFTFVVRSDQVLKRVTWDFGDGQAGDRDSVRHMYEGYGKHKVTVTGVSAQAASCAATETKEVEVYGKPVVAIAPLDTMGCSPLLYKPELTGEGFFMWDFGDGSQLSSTHEHYYENRTDTVQKHRIKAYVETDKGCRSVYEGLVTLYYLPQAAIDKEVVKGKPEKVTFLNLSKEATDCYWELPLRGFVHSFENQTELFGESGLYPVELVAESYYGCRDTTQIEHLVEMKGLYFPNTFIPGSSNERVNHFNGLALGLKEYRLEIYDNYGNKIWETRALENGSPSEGWDGRNRKGELMPQGTYVWRARAVFVNGDVWTGNNNDSGVRETVQGAVLLLRE